MSERRYRKVVMIDDFEDKVREWLNKKHGVARQERRIT